MIINTAYRQDGTRFDACHDCALPQAQARHPRFGVVTVRDWVGRGNGCAAVLTDRGEHVITREIELAFA